jgi:hypothetical protein
MREFCYNIAKLPEGWDENLAAGIYPADGCGGYQRERGGSAF